MKLVKIRTTLGTFAVPSDWKGKILPDGRLVGYTPSQRALVRRGVRCNAAAEVEPTGKPAGLRRMNRTPSAHAPFNPESSRQRKAAIARTAAVAKLEGRFVEWNREFIYKGYHE